MIAVTDLAVTNGSFSLEGISFEIPTGQYGILMGRTASGKTTILEAICGLKRIVAGRIDLDGRDVTHLKPALRGVGYVPQDSALFPMMTVRQHLAFALVVRKRPRAEIARRCDELAALLGLVHLLDRKPQGLSGGEAQRVALGRALAAHPRVLLLDEPLSSLDEETRLEMRGLLKTVQKHTRVTTLHVTHTLSEAVDLGDRLFRLEEGRIVDAVQPAQGTDPTAAPPA